MPSQSLEGKLDRIRRELGLSSNEEVIEYLVNLYINLRLTRIEARSLLGRLDKEYVNHCIGNPTFRRLLRLLRWLVNGQ